MRERLTPTMERVHQGDFTYLHLVYAGLSEEELMREVEGNSAKLVELSEAGEGLFLRVVDLNNTIATGRLISLLKEHSKLLKPLDKAVAILGISAGRRLLLDMINRFADTSKRAFKTEKDAIHWLREQHEELHGAWPMAMTSDVGDEVRE